MRMRACTSQRPRPAAATARGCARNTPRDVGARVFGTWRSPPLMEGVDVRRLLSAAPAVAAGVLRLRPGGGQPQVEQRHRQQNQQQQHQQQQQAEQRLLRQLEELQQQQAVDAAAAIVAAQAAATPKPLRLSWAGSGVYFWWQLGAMRYLSRRYDLTRVPMVGASGGALCAVLARCGVDADVASAAAYRLAREHQIWDRPMGLAGSWGLVIEDWLRELLPEDAAERCRGGLGVVVTEFPAWRQHAIYDFQDKEDLIDCCMASAHVPLLLDRQLTRSCRGAQYVDGSFPDFFTGENCDHLQCGGDAVVFDYFDDSSIVRQGRMDMLSLKRYSQLKRISLLGARYAARLEAEGRLDGFDLASVRQAGLKCR